MLHLGSVIVRKRNSGVDKIRNALATTIREGQKGKSQSVTVCQFFGGGCNLLCKHCNIMMHFPTFSFIIPLTLIFIQQFREKKWDSHLMIIWMWSQQSLGLWLNYRFAGFEVWTHKRHLDKPQRGKLHFHGSWRLVITLPLLLLFGW